MLYPSPEEGISDRAGKLVGHRFCHGPAAEAVYCGEDVAHSFEFVERVHDIEMNVVEFV